MVEARLSSTRTSPDRAQATSTRARAALSPRDRGVKAQFPSAVAISSRYPSGARMPRLQRLPFRLRRMTHMTSRIPPAVNPKATWQEEEFVSSGLALDPQAVRLERRKHTKMPPTTLKTFSSILRRRIPALTHRNILSRKLIGCAWVASPTNDSLLLLSAVSPLNPRSRLCEISTVFQPSRTPRKKSKTRMTLIHRLDLGLTVPCTFLQIPKDRQRLPPYSTRRLERIGDRLLDFPTRRIASYGPRMTEEARCATLGR